MRMPDAGTLYSTDILEVTQDAEQVALSPGRHDRTPGLATFILIAVLMSGLPLSCLVFGPSKPGDRLPIIAFTATMPVLAALGVLIFRFLHQRERARGPLLVYDLRRQTLECPRAGRSFQRADVIALQITHGLLARVMNNRHSPIIHQVTVVYRSECGLRRRLAFSLNSDDDSGFRLFRSEKLLAQFSTATGIPAHSDWIRGTKVRHDLITSPRPLTSAEFDIALDALPIIDPDYAPIDPSQLTPILNRAPQCRMCGYSLAGLTDTPVCPECGADFAARPTART